jgi:hypothetical protein
MKNETKDRKTISAMRGTGRIFQQGEIWWVAYYANGKERRESSKSMNAKDAKKLLKARLKRIHGGRYTGPEEEKLTVTQVLDALETQNPEPLNPEL